MGCLRNPQWEIFARELVELQLTLHRNARAKAYEKAGFAPSIDNARRLANRPEVKARVTELFETALEYRDVRPAQIVTRIDRVGRANVADFFEADGRTLKNIKNLPRELTEALKAIKYRDDGSVDLELWDKNQANFTLLKHYGGLPDTAPDQRTVNIFSVLNVDDQRALAEALESLPAGPAADDRVIEGERGEG